MDVIGGREAFEGGGEGGGGWGREGGTTGSQQHK